jgi:AcrR family transcriptional regulator
LEKNLQESETSADIRAAEKRRRILQAAWTLVLRQGLRGMTMEALAREVGIAKATLYAQFPDKDAVIAGVIDDMLVELGAAFDAGMAGKGSVAERVGAALASKYRFVTQALEGSPHADDIMNEHYRFAPRFAAFDQHVAAKIAAALASAGTTDAPALARIIIASAYGIACKLSSVDELDHAIRLMCRRMIAPEVRG